MTDTGCAVVAFGGGHGLAASLRALRRITSHLTAVVTVGDDGGSSGRLRTELGALPMGDLRMALAALAGTDTWSSTWAELFQHRFAGDGPLAGHAVGNLILTALAERHAGAVDALDLAARLLGIAGRVLPLSCEAMDIVAEVAGLDAGRPAATVEVRGQVAVATTPGRVRSLRLRPAAPAACPQALDAVDRAEWVVFGPGSLYTSLLPHLLVPEMTRCLARSTARRLVVLNLAPQPGETEGYSPEEHLRVIHAHAPALSFDVVVADRDAVPDPAVLARVAAELGARLYLFPVAHPGEARHDPQRLAAAFRTVFAMSPRGSSVAAPSPSAASPPAASPAGGEPDSRADEASKSSRDKMVADGKGRVVTDGWTRGGPAAVVSAGESEE